MVNTAGEVQLISDILMDTAVLADQQRCTLGSNGDWEPRKSIRSAQLDDDDDDVDSVFYIKVYKLRLLPFYDVSNVLQGYIYIWK